MEAIRCECTRRRAQTVLRARCAARCGDAGIRTPYLLRAKQALSQVSYIPPHMQAIPALSRCWWGILDSNQGPQSYQDCALTS